MFVTSAALKTEFVESTSVIMLKSVLAFCLKNTKVNTIDLVVEVLMIFPLQEVIYLDLTGTHINIK